VIFKFVLYVHMQICILKYIFNFTGFLAFGIFLIFVAAGGLKIQWSNGSTDVAGATGITNSSFFIYFCVCQSCIVYFYFYSEK